MSKKLPISAHVLTWNSGQTLTAALESLRSCTEILIVDGGSADNTLSTAESFGARVFPQRLPGAQGAPLEDFAAARNIGLQNAAQPWILTLDSDEEFSKEGMKEIAAIVGKADNHKAWRVPRHYRLDDGRIVTRASTYPNRRIYFFHRDAAVQWTKPVHERIRLKPRTTIGNLKHGSIAPLPPIGAFYSKLARYVAIEKQQSQGKGWIHWLLRRVFHTLRSRIFSTIRLFVLWIVPGGVRLPLRYELARYWYGWRLIVETCPTNY